MVPDAPGPARVGTRIREEFSLLGSIHVTDTLVDDVDHGPDRRTLRFSGGNPSSEVRGSRSVEAVGDGCRYTTLLELRPRGVQRWFAPLTARMLSRSVREDLDRLGDLVTRSPQPA
jgi:hypothetical protein